MNCDSPLFSIFDTFTGSKTGEKLKMIFSQIDLNR